MSRRRPGPRQAAPGFRFTVECDGNKSHAVRRIARVRVFPWPDAPSGLAVRVEYVNVADDPEDSDYTNPLRSDHMTRRFVCRECRRDVPVTDERLGQYGAILERLGQTHLRLREMSATVSRE